MERIPASGTLKMFELAKKLEAKGRKIYHFEVGEPDFPTPTNVVEAGMKAIDEGHTRYVSSRGSPPLLDAIADYYKQRKIKFKAQENIIVTPGAKMALFNGIVATIDRGDEVLCMSPAWPTYRVMIRMVGAKPVDVPMSSSFQLDEEALKNAMTRTVTALIINSPSNPTGGVLAKEHLKIIYDLACDHDFVVFSDEIYESLVYDGFRQTSMLDVDPDMKRSLIVNGFSKSYAMTGWRLCHWQFADDKQHDPNTAEHYILCCRLFADGCCRGSKRESIFDRKDEARISKAPRHYDAVVL